MDIFTQQVLAILFISLRIVPVFAFAPPFTLLRIPISIRLFLSLSLSMWLVLANPENSYERLALNTDYVMLAFGELLLGGILVLVLQWSHAAILTAGRVVDVQVGFGLALLIDPTSRAQVPLIGTVFAYAAGLTFFAIGGPEDLLAIWSESLRHMPLGAPLVDANISVFLAYISAVFVLAMGLAGVVLLTLFMIDLTVAFLSRTLPQMNVLLIGFQIKTLAVLATLPIAITYSSALYIRIVRFSLETAGRMVLS